MAEAAPGARQYNRQQIMLRTNQPHHQFTPPYGRPFSRVGVLLILALATCLLIFGCSESPTSVQQARNDLGVAQMGRYEYEAARDTFAALVDEQPEWTNARVNLAIATLNRQQEGDEARAFDILASVLETVQDEPRALYTSGIIELYLGNAESASGFFARVTKIDPSDAYAAYFLGQSYLQTEAYEKAASWLQQSIELDPYLRSGYWAAAQALRRTSQQDAARRLIEDYQRFESNPAAHTAGFSYRKMGPKAEVISDVVPTSIATPQPAGEPFDAAIRNSNVPAESRAFAFADINGDGKLDLYINGPSSMVMFSQGGLHTASVEHTLSGLDGHATAFVDADDDGDVDALVCRDENVEIYLQTNQQWRQSSVLPTPCSAIASFDADHDGDLDVMVTGVGGTELYNNNRDGTYRPIGRDVGFSKASLQGRQILPVDLDNDRDLDLFLFGQDGSTQVWVNDRTWRYEQLDVPALNDMQVIAATAGDTNADGLIDLYITRSIPSDEKNPLSFSSEISVITFQADGRTNLRQVAQLTEHAVELTLTDINGDSRQELMVSTKQGVIFLNADGHEIHQLPANSLVSAQPWNQPAGPGVFILEENALTYHPPGPGRFPYLSLELTGRTESDQMRSNASGLGTRIQVRFDGQWSVLDALDNHSGPGQSLMPVAIGLGHSAAADYVALTWSDGVSQTEIGLAADELHRIEETQRQLASCPVIFTWDGERFRFASDVLGVGGLGFFTEPGASAEPRPFERFLLPTDAMVPRDGRYLVKLTEPMEENAYLDQVTLEAIDVPNGWNVTLDERMSTAEPHATGRVITWRQAATPESAVNTAGVDVTQLIQHADRRAPEPGPVDSRFIGLLAAEQKLTLTFSEPLANANPVLVAQGWVEYPYSQTVFAAWQAGVTYQTATLEALDENGQWITVASEFGYPAGMPRAMALPLPALPEGTRTLRLRSNMEIYWDQVMIVYEESIDTHRTSRKPVVARINKIGFPRRTNGPQRIPHFDYHDRSPYWDTKYQHGYYTTLGDARPLVTKVDGALAIFGGGEEIHLEFDTFEAPSAGTTRHLLLDFRGWAKDMDLYTADGETVGPLPAPEGLSVDEIAHGQLLNETYNTRYQAGLR